MKITKILIASDLVEYLEARWLEKQYFKAKSFLLLWHYSIVQLKKRQPKEDWIFYFRINRQYRALCKIEEGVIKIFDIDDHQD